MKRNREKILRWSLRAFAILFFLSALLLQRASPASVKIDNRLLNRALIAIDRHYIDPSKIDTRRMLSDSLHALERKIPEMLAKEGDDKISITLGLAKKQFAARPLGSISDLTRVMDEITKFISENYSGDVKPEDIESTMINGVFDHLDPHSGFLSKKVYNEFKVGTIGNFGGLGIVITMKDGMLTVIAPLEDTPAWQAGIKAGDRILQIDDESTINMSLTDAVNKLRGKVGSKVALVVEREGRPSRKVALTRAVINIESVKYGLLDEGGKRIGYIRVKSFQANTMEDVHRALRELRKGGTSLDGMILDLRNNPGGLLNVAVDLADLFVRDGIIVSTVERGDEIMDLDSAHEGGTEPNYPMAVLIDEGSASASEIVAGALQALGRAVVMGNESFGKGSVQTVFELGDETALKLTVARYKPAGTEDIQLVGVIPDVELVPVVVDRDEMNLFKDELFSEEDLKEHLEKKQKEKEVQKKNSPFTVRYLTPKENDEDFEKKSAKEYSKALDIQNDFPVTIARRLIAKSKDAAREAMLKSGGGVIGEAGREQQGLIDAALKKLGVDWSEAPASGKPEIRLSQRILQNGVPVKRGLAGQKIQIELTATNAGSGTFARLAAVGQTKDVPLLSNLEFPFGSIAPGKSRAWSVPVELPQSLVSQNMLMDVNFEEGNGNAPKATKVEVPVEALPETQISFDYRIPSKGPKLIAPGITVPFDVEITNNGPGTTSDDVFAAISDECDDKVFIEKGRAKIGIMKPGEKKLAKLKFHILGGYDEFDCSVNLMLADMKRQLFLTKSIKVHPTEGKMIPEPGVRLSPPVIALKDVPLKVSSDKVHISGSIKDADPIYDYFIFAGEKKIDYVPNPFKSSTMNIEIDVPLEVGSNRILIGSRDEEKMVGTKAIAIERTEK